jgi:HEAT repeat protein
MAREALYKIGSYPSEATTPAGLKKATAAAVVAVLIGEDETAANAARTELIARGPSAEHCELLMKAVRADEQNRCWPQMAHIIAGWRDQKAALSVVEKFAADEHWRVRRTLAMALGNMKPTNVPDWCTKLLDDEEAWVRSTMLDALCKLTKGAQADLQKELVPLIIKGLSDQAMPYEYLNSGTHALAEIGPQHPDVVPSLIGFVQKARNENCRGYSATALGTIARRLRPDHSDLDRIVAALAKALEGESQADPKRQILYALKNLGPKAAAAIPAVIKATDDPDDYMAKQAKEALGAIRK